MSWHSVALFLHIVGALGLFAGISLEQAGLRGVRHASMTAALREWLTVMSMRRRMEGPSLLLLLVTGAYLVRVGGGMRPWIGVGLAGMVLIALMGGFATGRAVRALQAALPTENRSIPHALRRQAASPVLRAFAALRAALVIGIVFDMAVKPSAAGAAMALGVALTMGALIPLIGGRHALATREHRADH